MHYDAVVDKGGSRKCCDSFSSMYTERTDSYLATYIVWEYIKHLYVTGVAKRDPINKIVTI